jgi:hypothetical protein
MPRTLAAVLLLALLLAAPAPASARKVPRGWLGVIADGPMTVAGSQLGPEWDLMATTGVESVRTAFFWPTAQPYASAAEVPPAEAGRYRDAQGVPTDFSAYDATVLAAALRRLPVLPIVTGTPGWAGDPAGDHASPPRDPADYARFLTALVERYGPGGSLWAEHPEAPAQPIRDWQAWNEPNLTRYWTRQPFARPYVRLLKAARAALRAADPGARLILAGLPNESWRALRSVYRAGGRRSFDAVALHPYTGKPRNVVRLVRLARRVMRRHHDRRKPVWVTELSWPAAKGKTNNTAGFETTDNGQARRLREGLRRLAAARRRLRIERVYWYTWLSVEGTPNSFDYSGLRRQRDGQYVDVPALAVFRRAARRLEGCAKAAGDASRCR